jgi:acyl carrier protein
MRPELKPIDTGEIRKIVARRLQVPVESLRDDRTLEELGVNSLALAEAVVAIEEHYGIRVDTVYLAERVTPTLPLRMLLEAMESMVARAFAPDAG